MAKSTTTPINVFGMTFPHPVCGAPGLDINAERFHRRNAKFCGFVEIGPLSPLEENLPERRGLKSRKKVAQQTGVVPNKGVRYAIDRIRTHRKRSLIAVNLLSNSIHQTCDEVSKDILTAFSLMYDFGDIFILDVIRPNMDGVMAMQDVEFLSEVLENLISMRVCYDVQKPILVRVDTSVYPAPLHDMLSFMMLSGIDGVIAGSDKYCPELVKDIAAFTKGRFPIIGCGGIDTVEKAREILDAGACLVQVTKDAKSIAKGLLTVNKK